MFNQRHIQLRSGVLDRNCRCNALLFAIHTGASTFLGLFSSAAQQLRAYASTTSSEILPYQLNMIDFDYLTANVLFLWYAQNTFSTIFCPGGCFALLPTTRNAEATFSNSTCLRIIDRRRAGALNFIRTTTTQKLAQT